MNLGAIRAEIAAAVVTVDRAIRVVNETRDAIAKSTAELRITSTASTHPKPAEVVRLWNEAYEQAGEALARLNEGKGHANAYLRSL